MLYAILCYSDEAVSRTKSKADDDALMTALGVEQRKLVAERKLGPHLRLMPTGAATTLRYGRNAAVIDGPFAETKEQLLGFYIVDCASYEDALEVGRRLQGPRVAAGGSGALEIRPVATAVLEGGIG
jgi:hypothetical protein